MSATFDVLVIGAGPAGCVAAIELARAGARVALVDRHDFPRDKTCGDALLPDALRVLERLGLRRVLDQHARRLRGIRVYAPRGQAVAIAGECACVPRWRFDELLRSEAVRCGATFFPQHALRAPLVDDVVRGARFTVRSHGEVTLRAATTLLATGAAAEALKAFGVCERVTPSAIATRAYFKVDRELALNFNELCISYDRTICPGYGWVFPGPDDIFNVGVGCFHDSHRRPPVTNLRRLFDRFTAAFPPVMEVVRTSRQITPLKGAPLRTALSGARLAQPGLLVVGEAAGLTYSFSGEGIGKAMESGAIAAQAVLAQEGQGSGAAGAVAAAYEAQIRTALGSRFRAYKTAQGWLARPAIVDLLAWRATRSRFVMAQLEGMFQERVVPEQLFSVRGLAHALMS